MTSMKVHVEPGTYIVAVSGGVDSVVLLDLLANRPHLNLVVAHFDHGMRSDSVEDRKLAQKLAQDYGLPFEFAEGKLGAEASEATAREARYDFLRRVCKKYTATAIITAHHQDDVLETIVINWLRGTKSKGLSSLRSKGDIVRPLLAVTKTEIREYARKKNLTWREDSTNSNPKYLRNYVRLQIVPRMDAGTRTKLLEASKRAADLNDAIYELVEGYLQTQNSDTVLDRAQFSKLPNEVAAEVLVHWLRNQTDVTITNQLVERVREAIMHGRNGSRVDVAKGWSLALSRAEVSLFR